MIYFDNASTTMPRKEVLEEFLKSSKENFANPSSIHKLAMENSANIERIKLNILRNLKLDSKLYEVIFTSGATESNNLAILGFLLRNNKRFNHILTSVYEHASVLNVFKKLEILGFKVDYIKVKSDGTIDLDDLKNHLDGKPVFVSFMGVNNEIGTINDLKKLREMIGESSVFHSDLVQTIGKVQLNLNLLDEFSFTGHKIYGLKGCGVLIKKKKLLLDPILFGGGQQNNLRSGTLDYPSISAFNVALNLLIKNSETEYKKVKEIHEYLVSELSKIDGVKVHDFKTSSPYIVSLSLLNKKASVVVEALSNKNIFVNSESACYSKRSDKSYVLEAIGCDEIEASNPIRISLGIYNTLDEAKTFIEEFKNILGQIRS